MVVSPATRVGEMPSDGLSRCRPFELLSTTGRGLGTSATMPNGAREPLGVTSTQEFHTYLNLPSVTDGRLAVRVCRSSRRQDPVPAGASRSSSAVSGPLFC